MPSISLRLKDPHNIVANLTRPEWWQKYKEHVLRTMEIELPGFVSRFVANGNYFNSRTGNAVRSFRARSERNSVVIWSTADYLKHLNEGVRPHQMTYLLNTEVREYLAFSQYPYRASAPIPIKTAADGLIFRRATPKSMAEGKWQHPGIEGKHFLEEAVDAYMVEFRAKHPDLILELLD